MRPALLLSQPACWLCWLCYAAAASPSLLMNYLKTLGRQDIRESGGGIRRFLELRTGGGRRSCVWHWTGCIRNPLTGSEVVGVSGVETIRQLANSSYLSSRVLVYTEVGNSTAPLTSYRVRRQSPKRAVEPTRVVHELVTLGTEPRAATNLSNESQRRPFTQVSFPGGRTLRSKKIEFADVPHGGVKMVHYINGVSARRRPVNRWVSFAPDGGSSSQHGKNQEYYHIAPTPGAGNPFYGLAPWRLPLHALTLLAKRAAAATAAGAAAAGAGAAAGADMDGAAKANTLAQTRAQATMQCSRFGECPPWFSVGRTCTTELLAHRYSSLSQLPAPTLLLVEQVAPGFLSSSRALLAAADDSAALLEWAKGGDALRGERFKPWWRRLRL
jgi:hypothetical protein